MPQIDSLERPLETQPEQNQDQKVNKWSFFPGAGLIVGMIDYHKGLPNVIEGGFANKHAGIIILINGLSGAGLTILSKSLQ